MQKKSPYVCNRFCKIDDKTKQEIVTSLENLYKDLANESAFTCTNHHSGYSAAEGQGEECADHRVYMDNEVTYDCYCHYGKIGAGKDAPLSTLDGQVGVESGMRRNNGKPDTAGPARVDGVCPCSTQKQVTSIACCCGGFVMEDLARYTRKNNNKYDEYSSNISNSRCCICKNGKQPYEESEFQVNQSSFQTENEQDSVVILKLSNIEEKLNLINTNLESITKAIIAFSNLLNELSKLMASFKIGNKKLIKTIEELQFKLMCLENGLKCVFKDSECIPYFNLEKTLLGSSSSLNNEYDLKRDNINKMSSIEDDNQLETIPLRSDTSAESSHQSGVQAGYQDQLSNQLETRNTDQRNLDASAEISPQSDAQADFQDDSQLRTPKTSQNKSDTAEINPQSDAQDDSQLKTPKTSQNKSDTAEINPQSDAQDDSQLETPNTSQNKSDTAEINPQSDAQADYQDDSQLETPKTSQNNTGISVEINLQSAVQADSQNDNQLENRNTQFSDVTEDGNRRTSDASAEISRQSGAQAVYEDVNQLETRKRSRPVSDISTDIIPPSGVPAANQDNELHSCCMACRPCSSVISAEISSQSGAQADYQFDNLIGTCCPICRRRNSDTSTEISSQFESQEGNSFENNNLAENNVQGDVLKVNNFEKYSTGSAPQLGVKEENNSHTPTENIEARNMRQKSETTNNYDTSFVKNDGQLENRFKSDEQSENTLQRVVDTSKNAKFNQPKISNKLRTSSLHSNGREKRNKNVKKKIQKKQLENQKETNDKEFLSKQELQKTDKYDKRLSKTEGKNEPIKEYTFEAKQSGLSKKTRDKTDKFDKRLSKTEGKNEPKKEYTFEAKQNGLSKKTRDKTDKFEKRLSKTEFTNIVNKKNTFGAKQNVLPKKPRDITEYQAQFNTFWELPRSRTTSTTDGNVFKEKQLNTGRQNVGLSKPNQNVQQRCIYSEKPVPQTAPNLNVNVVPENEQCNLIRTRDCCKMKSNIDENKKNSFRVTSCNHEPVTTACELSPFAIKFWKQVETLGTSGICYQKVTTNDSVINCHEIPNQGKEVGSNSAIEVEYAERKHCY